MTFERLKFAAVCGAIMFVLLPAASSEGGSDRSIKPYSRNPWYWEYQGKPVVLIGGTDEDNLFQWTGRQLTDHLDLLVSVGGNYVRNTMSDRDEGNVFAFKEIREGVYDLDQWNEEYWDRLRFFLEETAKRGIIVQLTLWDSHDRGGGGRWGRHPWNPANNINMGAESWNRYTDFYTTPAGGNPTGLSYQQKFIDRMLSITLKYGHVLYNIHNESARGTEWENHWARHIHKNAADMGRKAYVTSMRMSPSNSVAHILAHPELYNFADISQNNQDSRGAKGPRHWDNILAWRQKLASRPGGPMPVNNEKVYGSGQGENRAAGTEAEAIDRHWRNILGGCASSRFHRIAEPRMWGTGLNERVQVNLKAMSMLLKELDIVACSPLEDAKGAYATANIGRQYAVYFAPGGGSVELDLRTDAGKLSLRWLDIEQSAWSKPVDAQATRGKVKLETPGDRRCVAFLEAKEL